MVNSHHCFVPDSYMLKVLKVNIIFNYALCKIMKDEELKSSLFLLGKLGCIAEKMSCFKTKPTLRVNSSYLQLGKIRNVEYVCMYVFIFIYLSTL